MSYPQQPQPAQFPPYAPQPAPPKRTGKSALVTIVAVIVTAAVCGGGGIAIGSSGKSTTKTVAGPTVTVTATDQAAPAAAATTAPAKTAKPKPTSSTVLSFSGDGIKNSKKFTTGDDWTIHYSFNCSNFGGSGNFAVTYYTDGQIDDIAINELKKKGSGSAPVYDDAGSHYLSVNSECSWKISVTR